MPDQPTGTGQNLIIQNLNKIFLTIVSLGLAGMFAWANNLSKAVTTQRDEYDKTIVLLTKTIENLEKQQSSRDDGIQKELNGVEGDVSDLQTDAERVHDELKSRIIHLEDFNNYKK